MDSWRLNDEPDSVVGRVPHLRRRQRRRRRRRRFPVVSGQIFLPSGPQSSGFPSPELLEVSIARPEESVFAPERHKSTWLAAALATTYRPSA